MTTAEIEMIRKQADNQIHYALDLDGFHGTRNVVTWCETAKQLCNELEKYMDVVRRVSMARRSGLFGSTTKEYILAPLDGVKK